MLESLRNGANTWAAKFLLGILALSFVLLFGPGSFSGLFARSGLATVGSTTITQPDFQRAYDNELNALSQRARRRITAEEARTYGIDRRVISRLVGTAALDTQVNQLGLALSDETIAASLQNDPNFKGLDGKFDRTGFNGLIQQMGLTERGFLDLKRKEDQRAQLTSTLLSAIVTPKPMIAAIHNWRDETRVIEFATIDADKAITVPEPDAAKLKETYETNKPQFMAPEYRQLQILMLSVTDLASKVVVSDADVAASYEQTKENFATPELRRVQQIAFKDKAAAEAAKAAIDGGKNFMTVAQEAGFKEKDVEIGLVTKKTMIDPKIATAAFGLERDKVSSVVDGKFATVLLRIPEIQPGKQPTLDEVKSEVKDKLARGKAKDEVQKLRDQVEDMRNAAKSDKEIADTLQLKIVDVAQTDATNKTADGKTALENADARGLIASGFDAKSGAEREAVELADGGVAWVTSKNVTPPRQKTYEEVEADVKTLYFATNKKRLLAELAQILVDRLNKGDAFETIASEVSAKADKTPAITRTTSPQGLTEQAVTQAFGLPKGRAQSAESADKKSRTLFRVAEIKAPDAPNKEQADKLSKEIGQDLQVEIIDSYVAALQEAVGVNINELELRRMAGSSAAQ